MAKKTVAITGIISIIICIATWLLSWFTPITMFTPILAYLCQLRSAVHKKNWGKYRYRCKPTEQPRCYANNDQNYTGNSNSLLCHINPPP